MPSAIPQELRKLIDEVLKQEAQQEIQKHNSELAKMFKVSIPYIKKRKQALGLSRPKPEPRPKPPKVEKADTQDTEDTAPQDTVEEEGYTLEVPPHGRGKLVRGVHPNGGRKKGSKAGPATLQDIASFFNEIDPTSEKKHGAQLTYLERFLIGCVHQAESGKEAYASMIFSALEKAGQTIKLTIENASIGTTGDAPKALADPLFSAMDNERLRFEALRVLEAQYSQPLDAEFKEVQEA